MKVERTIVIKENEISEEVGQYEKEITKLLAEILMKTENIIKTLPALLLGLFVSVPCSHAANDGERVYKSRDNRIYQMYTQKECGL